MKRRSLIHICALFALAQFVAIVIYAQQLSPQEFYQTQVAAAFRGMRDPAAANLRVRSIWLELVQYSKHMFPVYPAQQFDAGQATLGGIYLDVSIAADPSIEVTRFFLAHEWGHMMHGDPLNQLTPIGRYRMTVGARAAEDAADTYAATFFRYQHHDIRPVIAFFCDMPDSGPGDSHANGVDRAKHVARIYGSPGDIPDVSCAHDPVAPNHGPTVDPAPPTPDPVALKESARKECRDKYGDCVEAVMSADQCIENNVSRCTKACAPNPWRCPDGCDESRFSGTCREIEKDQKQKCREKRDQCLKDVDDDDN
jgi:hypothetical protein